MLSTKSISLALVVLLGFSACSGGDDSARGSEGEAGSVGAKGATGEKGITGDVGTGGPLSLINMSDEPMGVNCDYGGVRIESGVDTNANNTLEASEVQQTAYSCSDTATYFEGMVFNADKTINGMYELYTIVAGKISKLVAPPKGYQSITKFDFSPDKSMLAYIAGPNLYLIDLLHRSTPIQLNPDLVVNGAVSSFKWSPDGTRIAYRGDQDTNGVSELYSVLPDGSGNKKLNQTPVLNGEVLSTYHWAPDSSLVAYIGDIITNDTNEVFANTPDGFHHRQLSITSPDTVNMDIEDFAWMPDSETLIFRSDYDVDGTFELQKYKVNGTPADYKSLVTLGADRDVLNFKISPNGHTIAYQADQDVDEVYELYTIASDGSSAVPSKVNDVMQANGDIYSYFWSPDGSRLAYIADRETDNINEIYAAAIDGSNHAKLNNAQPSDISFHFKLVWSHDSTRVLCSIALDSSQLEMYAFMADGSSSVKINPDFSGSQAVSGYTYLWSDDDSVVYYKAKEDTNTYQLYMAPSNGSQVSTNISGDMLAYSQVDFLKN